MFLGKARHLVSAIFGTAMRYSWTEASPNRSRAFLQAGAELRKQVRTE